MEYSHLPETMTANHESVVPSTDDSSNYDHRSKGRERGGHAHALDDRIEGEVRFDQYSRQLYATDASAYETTPIGVVFPSSTEDVASVMAYCADTEIPVLPRGGGTSLAGQAVNEAVVLGFTRYMANVLSVSPETGTARAQVGKIGRAHV